MSNATLQVGGGNWAAQDGKLLGYAVEPTSGRYLAREFTVNRNSSKWVLGSDGYLYEVPADQPALEYYSDGTFRGALVEPQSINLCKQSEDIGTIWAKSNDTTVTTNAANAPDGTSTADKLGDDGATGTGNVWVSQAITVSVNTKYTASVFLKSDGLSFALLQADGYDGIAQANQFFGLSGAGSTGTGTNLDDSRIEAYPNGWYRCSITWTQGAADTSFTFRVWVANSISSLTVDLDGTSSIFVWGTQVEESPIATSYIPTTTGAVTRLKDDIFFTNASSVIGQSEGTLFIEVDWQLVSGTAQVLLMASDGTSGNRVQIYVSANNLLMQLTANNSTQTLQGVSSTGYSGIQKIAFAYKTDDFELYRNGSSISTDTSGSLASLATLTDVDFGQFYSASFQVNMWIRDARIYNTRLTDTECQDLTTL